MIKQDQFAKRVSVRRKSDLQSVKQLSSIESLPVGSILHEVDNFAELENIVITPTFDNSLMQLKPEKKRIAIAFHDPKETDLFKPDTDGIKFYKQGVRDALKTFKQSNASTVKYTSMDNLPDTPDIQSVISYNTLFNTRVTGKFKIQRMFNFVISEILNNTVELKDRIHYLHFEMPTQEFSRSDFLRATKNMDWKKMAYPNSMNYLLMLHLLAFLDEESDLSFFDKLPEPLLKNINIALTHKHKAVFYNLFTLREIAYESSGADLSVIAQHNHLVEEEEHEIQVEQQVDNGTISTPQEYTETMEKIFSRISENNEIEATDENIEFLKTIKIHQNTEAVNKAIDSLLDGKSVKTDASFLKTLRESIETRKNTPQKNASGYKGVPETSEKEATLLQFKDLSQKEQEAIKRIDENSSLTTAQKNRAKKAVKKYQDLKVPDPDGTEMDFMSLLTQPPVNEKDNGHLDFLEGQVRDESILDSTIDKMDAEYMEKQFHRDLARTIMSFPDMHPIDINVERTDDQVNRFDTYTVKFQDDNLKTHTVKFTLPLVDEDGKCRLNGVEKQMKKQRINNPICKVSPVRVSLTSNYNKMLVERNQSNANSFYPRISKILSKSDMDVTYSACYPIDKGPYMSFPEDEHKDIQKDIDQGRSWNTLRVSDEYDKFIDDSVTHASSPFGELDIVKKQKIKSLSDYPYAKYLNQDRLNELKNQDKILWMEVKHSPIPITLPYEYTTLAKKIAQINKNDLHLNFCYYSRFDGIKPALFDTIRQIESAKGTFIGTVLNRNTGCFINIDSSIAVIDLVNGSEIATTYLIDLLTDYGEQEHKPFNEWISIKILNRSLPLGFALCYRFGLTHMLNYLGTDYEVSQKGSRDVEKPKSSSVHLKFSDNQIIIRKPRFVDKVIFSGLNHFTMNKYYQEDMDSKDVYYDMLDAKGMSTNLLKGIDSFFTLFIDPITEDILRQMGEPTNFKDLLLRAVALLMSEDHDSAASTANTHIRTYNRMVAAAYNELARGYATYKSGSLGASDKFSINTEGVYRKIIGDQLMDNANTVSPIQVFRDKESISHMGDGGRVEETFTKPDRQFVEDNIGIISEATVDSGKVAINADLTANPNLQTLTGLGAGVDPEEVTPSQLLSITGVAIAGTTHDDGKRANFTNIQSKHVVPTEHGDVYPIKTGYEKVMAHRCSPPFAFSAEEDGKVLDIDEENNMVKIQYKSGKTKVFHYGDEVSDNPGGGFSLTQHMELNGIKKGSSFKRGDVLAYNDSFFKPDPYSNQVEQTLGVKTLVAFIEDDTTLEDSSSISKELADKLNFKPVQTKDVVIPINTNLHYFADLATEVSSTDPLMVFDEAEVPESMTQDADPELIEMLGELNKATPRAGYDGNIKNIEVFYSNDFQDMSSSVAKAIRKINKIHNAKAKFSEDADNKHKFPNQDKLKRSTRVSNVQLDEDVVVFKFYIEENSTMRGGDKLIYASSLKSVVCEVNPNEVKTEDGSLTVDAKSSWRGLNNRIVTGAFLTGLTARVIQDMEDNVKEMLED